ncbi:hypothetical protein BK025_00515 [Sodalis sp. TME1]|nr:hypothetical protein BK025_00515 [Sodalis sp. TME1]
MAPSPTRLGPSPNEHEVPAGAVAFSAARFTRRARFIARERIFSLSGAMASPKHRAVAASV